jgi:hypothetical protein
MKKNFGFLVATLVLAATMAQPAEARRRGFGFFSIPSGETVVKVMDLPNVASLKRTDGSFVDLGYKFNTVGGEWVGYVGSNSTYLKLSETEIKMLLLLGGKSGLPPIPDRPAGSKAGSGLTLLLGGLGILAVLFKIFKTVMGLGSKASRALQSVGQQTVSQQQVDHSTALNAALADRLDQRIAQAAAVYSNGPSPQQYSTPYSTSGNPSFGKAPAPSFGKRT